METVPAENVQVNFMKAHLQFVILEYIDVTKIIDQSGKILILKLNFYLIIFNIVLQHNNYLYIIT